MKKKKAALSRKDKSFRRGWKEERYPAAPIKENPPFAGEAERVERLKEVLQNLYEINKRIPIIVEGRRDALALRKIGLVGDIITLHRGKGLYEFCEETAERYHRVILLMDWDEKGELQQKAVSEHLTGMWEEFSAFREIIKLITQKEIKDIEGIPVLLERLAGAEVKVGEPEEALGFPGDI